MILLTRLNNQSLTVNSDLIKFVEQSPDTVITLLNGEKLLVRESAEEIRSRVVAFRRSVLMGIFPVLDPSAVLIPMAQPPAAELPTEEPAEQRR